MSTTTPTSEYLFLFRGCGWDKGMSAEEFQAAMSKFMGWFERLSAEGKLKASQPLGHEGRTVSGKNGRSVADGPFAESKESIAGYLIVYADSLDAAVRLAQECPNLEHGVAVEVRPVAAECPSMHRLREAGLADFATLGA